MRKESPKRSIAKSMTWRVVASLTTIVIALIITGDIAVAASIGVIEVVAKLAIFYLHDRAWNKVSWGVIDDKD